MSKTTHPQVFVVEGHYRSDRHGNLYWGPILHPQDTERYAIFTDEADAQECIAFIEDRDLAYYVGIMGNDFPERYRVVEQTTRGTA